MSGFIFEPTARVQKVGFLAIVRNVVCTKCRGARCMKEQYRRKTFKSFRLKKCLPFVHSVYDV